MEGMSVVGVYCRCVWLGLRLEMTKAAAGMASDEAGLIDMEMMVLLSCFGR